ncbi:MAG TPA: hypothetical protein VHL11_13430, partial [Phototrophicaceae bacterium]|nr:hypothetical protein [Phototrophicaceae bacterium]
GDGLTISAYINAKSSATNGKIKLRVAYGDGTGTGKRNLVIAPTTGYTQLLDNYALESGNVIKIKVQINNRSTAGKFFTDDVGLMLTSGSGVSLIPLP